MRTFTRLRAILLLTFTTLATLASVVVPMIASAAITVQAHYRLGEDDVAASVGAAGAATTSPAIGATALSRVGTPSYVVGVGNAGLGVNFNGTNGYRFAGIINGMNVRDNFGIEVSVRTDVSVTGDTVSSIFGIGNSATSGFAFYRRGNNYTVLYGGVAFIGAVPVSSRWTRLALVRQSGVSTFYADGVVVASSNLTPGLPSNGVGSGTAIGIRLQSSPPFEFFNGSIDDARAFTFAPGAFVLSDLGAARLSVSTSGSGMVSSVSDGSPAGISCGTTCNSIYLNGTTVELAANPQGGATFLGWQGACVGRDSCVVNMSSAQSVSALFSPLEQRIVFQPLPNVTLATATVALVASATSGLTVAFSSATPATCTVNGGLATLTGVPGMCALVATQDGNGVVAAASARQSFVITAVGVASAPQNLSCSATAVAAATCRFDLPASSGDAPVTGYTLSCQADGGAAISVSGATSPLTISDLPTGRLISCTVTASNARGASLSGEGNNGSGRVIPLSRVVKQGGIDVDGDGRGEVLIRVANSAALLGKYDQTRQRLLFAQVDDPSGSQRLLGVGDFGGRTRSDLLMQDVASGDVRYWLNFDGSVDGVRAMRNVKPGWVVEAVADMDGDGKSDIVWRYVGSPLNPPTNPNDVGVVFVWYMNRDNVDTVRPRGGAPLGWSVLGAADLRGNGLADLIWISPAGQVRSATSNASRSFVNELIGNIPAGFTATRLADFDGDGRADILFRNQAGKLKLWSMNGIRIARNIDLPDSDPLWELFAIADLNGDGTVDIVFRKPDNTLVLWLMNGTSPAMPTVIDNAGGVPVGAVNIEP